jgi:enolase
MAKIKKIIAFEILDSSGFPTLFGRLICDNGIEVEASVSSNSFSNKLSAYHLKDNDEKRFLGKGVLQAAYYINNLLAPKLYGVELKKHEAIERWLIKADGTKNKQTLGANTTLLLSYLLAKAAAKDLSLPLYVYLNQFYSQIINEKIPIKKLPTPVFNLISGGKHSENAIDFQEFEIIPSSRFSFSQSLQMAVEFFHTLKTIIVSKGAIPSLGMEGGFTPLLSSNLDALELLKETASQKHIPLGLDIFFGIDVSTSYFYKNNHFVIKDRPKPQTKEEFFSFLKLIIKNYPILLLEDPSSFDDFEYWQYLSSNLPQEIYLVADEVTSGNKERLRKVINKKAASAVVVKPSEIGTLLETMEFIALAKKNNLTPIISHLSSETNETILADLAVSIQADLVKFGAPSRGERVAKYNRLWEIEREINGEKIS